MDINQIKLHVQALRQQFVGMAMQCEAILNSIEAPHQPETPAFVGMGQPDESVETTEYEQGYIDGEKIGRAALGMPASFGQGRLNQYEVVVPVTDDYISGFQNGWRIGHAAWIASLGTNPINESQYRG